MVRKSYIDEIGIKILEILRKNARTPYTKIAELVGLSEAGVRKRIRKLEERGIIKRYTIEVNYKLLGYKIVWIGVDVKPEKLIKALEIIKSVENVQSLYTSSGDHDIMIEFVYSNPNQLAEFIKKLENIEGVTKVCPAVLVEKIK